MGNDSSTGRQGGRRHNLRRFRSRDGKSLAFAYVPPDATAEGTAFDIMMFGEMRKARIIPGEHLIRKRPHPGLKGV